MSIMFVRWVKRKRGVEMMDCDKCGEPMGSINRLLMWKFCNLCWVSFTQCFNKWMAQESWDYNGMWSLWGRGRAAGTEWRIWWLLALCPLSLSIPRYDLYVDARVMSKATCTCCHLDYDETDWMYYTRDMPEREKIAYFLTNLCPICFEEDDDGE